MKLTHLLAGIVVVAGGVAGATKGYVHYQVKSGVDEFIDSARLFADIRYDGLDTDLSGSVTLHRLSILPHHFPDHFEIEAVTVSGPDMDFLLNGFGKTKQRGELPKRAALAIRGWRVRADSALIHATRKASRKLAELMKVDSDSCSLGQVFGTKDFAALGYDEFLVDMQIGYSFTDSFPGLEVGWDFHTAGESGNFKLTFVDVSHNLQQAPQKAPRLRDMQLTYRLDPEFTGKMIDYCAKQRAVDRDTYITQLGTEPDALYQVYLGFVPGPGLREALQELLRNPGELHLSAQPLDPLDLTTLNLYKPSQIPDLFGLTLTVNDRPVEDLSLAFLDLGADLDQTIREEIQGDSFWNELGFAGPSSTAPAPAATVRAVEPARYRTVERTKLAEHIGREVRIVATGGRKRSGLLRSVERGVATLDERKYGGVLTTTIALSEIVAAETHH